MCWTAKISGETWSCNKTMIPSEPAEVLHNGQKGENLISQSPYFNPIKVPQLVLRRALHTLLYFDHRQLIAVHKQVLSTIN